MLMTPTLEVDQLLPLLHPIMLEIMFPPIIVGGVAGEGDVPPAAAPPVAARAVAEEGRGGPGHEGPEKGSPRNE